jgi:hypothetical protein
MSEADFQIDPEFHHVNVGARVPHDPDDLIELPLGQWDLHTPDSWARAVLQEAMDHASRPPMATPGHDQPPPRLPQGNTRSLVQLSVMRLDDGSVGVGLTFARGAWGGSMTWSHHLIRLPVRASEPLTGTDT